MVDYRYEPDRNLLLVTVTGPVTDADFADANFPDVPSGTLELLDLAGAGRPEISTARLRHLAETDTRRPQRIARMAILVTTDVAFGLARMYQTLSSEMKTEVQIFRDRDQALAWLGV